MMYTFQFFKEKQPAPANTALVHIYKQVNRLCCFLFSTLGNYVATSNFASVPFEKTSN